MFVLRKYLHGNVELDDYILYTYDKEGEVISSEIIARYENSEQETITTCAIYDSSQIVAYTKIYYGNLDWTLQRAYKQDFILEGNGIIKDYYGSYSAYRFSNERASETSGADKERKTKRQKKSKDTSQAKTRLSYNEQREYAMLEKEIPLLEAEKKEAESLIGSGKLSYEELNKLSSRIAELITLIDQKTDRWLELDEYV